MSEAATQEAVEMTTTVAKPDSIPSPFGAARSRRRRSRRRPLVLAGSILTLAAVSVGTWLIVAQASGGRATDLEAAAPVATWTAPAQLWVERLDLIRLKNQLVRAGYSIKVDGKLDPVAKSGLADYLRPDAAHPLSPSLVRALAGTVITGLRNPVAWDLRFGLNRPTKFVERPLTGPGGQLDANGNDRTRR